MAILQDTPNPNITPNLNLGIKLGLTINLSFLLKYKWQLLFYDLISILDELSSRITQLFDLLMAILQDRPNPNITPNLNLGLGLGLTINLSFLQKYRWQQSFYDLISILDEL